MIYTAENLLIHPDPSPQAELITSVDPATAGGEFIHFQSRRLKKGKSWSFISPECELAVVVLSGTVSFTSNLGQWLRVGKRKDVFSGLPEALYLPQGSSLTVDAETDCEFAITWVPSEHAHPPRLIRQEEITVEVRGGDNVTRHINGIIRPGFDCDRLVVVEVYTPSGNWSSYPPHKHDVRRFDPHGKLVEADLEEIYYFKLDKPEGYAIQRVYTGADSPLTLSGNPIDSVLLLRDNDLVLVPEGYHPVVSAPGYTTYYLNVLAGSDQALTAADDPRYSWVKETYRTKDNRVPIFPVDPRQII